MLVLGLGFRARARVIVRVRVRVRVNTSSGIPGLPIGVYRAASNSSSSEEPVRIQPRHREKTVRVRD